MRTMKEVVDEYNSVTGESIKRFSTVEVGEKRLAQAKEAKTFALKPTPKGDPDTTMHRITVDGVKYRSVASAFEALKLPMGRHIRLRGKLNKSGKEVFEHDGKQYKFAKC